MDYWEFRDLLSKKFSTLIRTYLSKEEVDSVVSLNRVYIAENVGVCATHDYIDANVVMDEAFRYVLGREARMDSEEDCSLINDAWNLAKEKEFKW